MRVHLVDGTYELFRAFYGAPPATAPDGREVGAVRALVRSLASLLSEPDVSHVAIAFDSEIESFRNALFPGYKTGAGIEPALASQFGLAEEAAVALGLVTWRMHARLDRGSGPPDGFECDDALATMAARAAGDPRVSQVVVCSPDKDLAQCLRGERVVRLDRMRRRVLDEAGLRAQLGIAPGSVPDWLALVGDAADGIPGIPRWGEKSASAVLGAYGTIASIPGEAAAWTVRPRGAEALARELAAHREEASLYRTLATLRTDAPIAENVDDLAWRGAPGPALDAFLGRLGQPGLDRLRRL